MDWVALGTDGGQLDVVEALLQSKSNSKEKTLAMPYPSTSSANSHSQTVDFSTTSIINWAIATRLPLSEVLDNSGIISPTLSFTPLKLMYIVL